MKRSPVFSPETVRTVESLMLQRCPVFEQRHRTAPPSSRAAATGKISVALPGLREDRFAARSDRPRRTARPNSEYPDSTYPEMASQERQSALAPEAVGTIESLMLGSPPASNTS